MYGTFFGGDSPTTAVLVIVTLVTEAALLIVAAQAGFLAGPRVLANMSLDSWVPHRLSHLSDQLVTRNGVWFMGLTSLGFLIYSQGHVKLLVVMYSINVFLVFTLSQMGMCRHWWEVRRSQTPWHHTTVYRRPGLASNGDDFVRNRNHQVCGGRLGNHFRHSRFRIAVPSRALALRPRQTGAQEA